MTIRNLVICIGSAIFGITIDSQASDLAVIAYAQKEAGMTSECGHLLLSHAPVFFDEVCITVSKLHCNSHLIIIVTIGHIASV